MTAVKLENLVETINDLIPMPHVLSKSMRLLDDPDVSANEIADMMGKDEALATKILKVVNSAYYGIKNPIANLQRAIVILGFQNVKNVAVGVSLVSSDIDFPSRLINRSEFWKHQLAAAAFAQQIAEAYGFKINREDVYLGSFLHDIGKLAMIHYLKERYDESIKKALDEGEHVFKIERTLFSFDHQQVGFELCNKWNFPKYLAEAILRHHKPLALYGKPVSPQDQLEFTVIIANQLANMCSLGTSGDYVINTDTFPFDSLLKLSEERITNVTKIFYDTVRLFELDSTVSIPALNTCVCVSLVDKKMEKLISTMLLSNQYRVIADSDIDRPIQAGSKIVFIHDDITLVKKAKLERHKVPLKLVPFSNWKDLHPEKNINCYGLLKWIQDEARK